MSFPARVDARPTDGDESGCHPEPVRFAQGKLREGSAVSVRGELIQILRFAQNDSDLDGAGPVPTAWQLAASVGPTRSARSPASVEPRRGPWLRDPKGRRTCLESCLPHRPCDATNRLVPS